MPNNTIIDGDAVEYFFYTSADTKIFVREWGGRHLYACILIHGIAEGGFVWDEAANKLASICRVIAVDLRGHGQSDHVPEGNYDIDAYAGDLNKLIEFLGLKKFILMGHSLGGIIATHLARVFGDNLLALIIVDAGPLVDPKTTNYMRLKLVQSQKRYNNIEEYAEFLLESRPLSDPHIIRRMASKSLKETSTGDYVQQFDPALVNFLELELDKNWWLTNLNQIKMPILIVRGLGSAILTKDAAVSMKNATICGEVVTIKNSGHSVMIDNPQDFSLATTKFIFNTLQIKMRSSL